LAYSPSERWENGVLVERAIETNRWSVDADGNPIDSEAETKQVAEAEDKSVASAKTTRKSSKKK
jgi:hypothetical protein